MNLTNTEPALRRAWHTLCRSEEVTATPRAFRLLGENWVAYRTSAGTPLVFLDRCPHRFAPLSMGSCEGATLRCVYHGWVFDEDGRCVEIPALGEGATLPSRAQLTSPAGIFESHSMLFIAPEEPLTPRPRIAAAEDAAFLRGDLAVIETRASAALLADNFLDMAHFPFIHKGTFGADEAREVPNYSVTRDGYPFEAAYEHDFAHREDPGVAAGLRPLVQRRRLTYRYVAPFHLELAIDFLDAGGTNVIGFFLSPIDDERVRIYSSLWRNDLDGSIERMREAIDFEVAVIDEDLALQSRMEVLSMPLDITSEVHTRADKTTVELRRILADLVAATS
ncbi:MAG TPA: aromatic ring-hydroxylating dioxygenase subunit alpha [Acidimicrobiales bacterium]|nr:aromatic ring-hydroxylating dioxygenase subunit alpha [Acidimicrobiales bacterium]